MKQTLTTHQAAQELYDDQYAGWSWAGAYALVEYIEEWEEESDTEIEMDVVAIRCDFSEYGTATEAAEELSDWEPDPDDDEGEKSPPPWTT